MKQIRFVVYGLVQGVGFRQFVYRKANKLSLTGYVKNLPDGSVECLAMGTKEQLASLEQSMRRGPSFSRVDSITSTQEQIPQAIYTNFIIQA